MINLSKQVLKSDVEAALKVLNFAIYHKELTEMEEREEGRERELEKKRRVDGNAGETDTVDHDSADREG